MKVLKEFRLGGRTYAAGSDFDPRKTAVSARTVRSLEEMGQISSGTENAPQEKPAAEMRHVGGGWYEVTVDGKTEKVHGRAAAEAKIGG